MIKIKSDVPQLDKAPRREKLIERKPSAALSLDKTHFESYHNCHEARTKSRCPREEVSLWSRTPFKNREAFMEVTATGTDLLKEIGLPTVLIKVFGRKLCKAMLHYVILTPIYGSSIGDIPALLVSHPRKPAKGRTTCLGELLPLVIENSKAPVISTTYPLLQNHAFHEMFKNGCMFKLKLINLGRLMDGPSLTKNPELLKRLIYRDIQNMPNTFRLLAPLRLHDERSLSKVSSLKLEDLETKKNAKTPTFRKQNLSDFASSSRLQGLRACGGECDFASWFSIISPNVKVDMDFKCDKGILRRDCFTNVEMLNSYLGVSEIL